MSKIERRQYQIDIVNKIVDAYQSGIKNVFLEAPTGSGKSVIAYLVHKEMERRNIENGSVCILSHQKTLQDQYDELLSNFSNSVSLKGQDNYECNINPSNTVANALCRFPSFRCPSDYCEYYDKRKAMKQSPLTFTNYSMVYKLLDVDRFDFPKTLFVYDECHNVPMIFTDYCKVVINNETKELIKHIYEVFEKIGVFTYNEIIEKISNNITLIVRNINNINEDNVFAHFEGIFENIKELMDSIEEFLESHGKAVLNNQNLQKLAIHHSTLYKYHCKYENLIKNKQYIIDNGNFVVEKSNDAYTVIDAFDVSIIPIYIGDLFKETADTCSKYKLYMSSTIFDIENFVSELGLSKEKYAFFEMDSRFPVENRAVIYFPFIQLNNKVMSGDLSSYFDMILKTLSHHAAKKENGVILTPSYAFTKRLIVEMGRDIKKLGYRILSNENSSGRVDVVEDFTRSDGKMKILISPSFYEGMNFKDDISRFQIISKVPFKSLMSNYVKKRLELSAGWYEIEALKHIVQGCGRSIRSEEDYSITYIFDKNFGRIFDKNKDKLPKWFVESVQKL